MLRGINMKKMNKLYWVLLALFLLAWMINYEGYRILEATQRKALENKFMEESSYQKEILRGIVAEMVRIEERR